MPSPFPGMDPYLEHPRSWPNFHHRLITAIAIHLGPQLRPKYRVVVEEAMYQTATPDSASWWAFSILHSNRQDESG
jgi:hypothetical protein